MARLRPWSAGLAGVMVGALGISTIAGLGWTNESDRSAETEAAVLPTVEQAFLDKWRESRMGTWVVESDFTRQTEAGGRLAFTVHHAQRPPDRLLLGFGSVVARRGDQLLACAGGGRGPGTLRCRSSATAEPWAAEVDAEIETLAGYFAGASPLYTVTGEGRDCFDLTLRRPILSAPYGTRARFCFDPATAAPTLTEIRRPEGTDITRAIEVRGKVTEADLAPPPESAA